MHDIRNGTVRHLLIFDCIGACDRRRLIVQFESSISLDVQCRGVFDIGHHRLVCGTPLVHSDYDKVEHDRLQCPISYA